MAPNNKGNVVVVIIVVAVILIGGYLFLTRLPSLINKTLQQADFSNAQILEVKQDLSTVSSAKLTLSINKGNITVDETESAKTLTGQIKYLGQKPTINYLAENKTGAVTINSTDQEGEERILHLPTQIPVNIDAAVGVGIINFDLSKLQVPTVNVAAGAGTINITFSDKYSTKASLASGVGSLNMRVPKNAGLRIGFAQGVTPNIKFGDAYEKVGDAYQTKNYSRAVAKIDLNIGQAVGGINLEVIE